MAEASGSHKETAAWAIGVASLSLLTAWAGAVQIIQEPLERDMASMSRRLDDAVLDATAARNRLQEQFDNAIRDTLVRSEERRLASVAHQNEINGSYGSALGDLAVRINRIEQDRARVIENAIGRLQQIEDNLKNLDARLAEIEKTYMRVPRSGTQR